MPEARLQLLQGFAASIRQDYASELAIMRKLAASGYAPAEATLGIMYAEGQGGPKDLVLAAAWRSKAEAHGDRDAGFTSQTGSVDANVACRAANAAATDVFFYFLKYQDGWVADAGTLLIHPAQITEQTIRWESDEPDGRISNVLDRYSGTLTQVGGTDSFSFKCDPATQVTRSKYTG